MPGYAPAFQINSMPTNEEVSEQHQVFKNTKSWSFDRALAHLAAPPEADAARRLRAVPFISTPYVFLASFTPRLNYGAWGLLSNGSYLSY